MKKISVISGGSSGLGLEIADILVKSGKDVLILGRSKEKLIKASAKLNKSVNVNSAGSLVCNIGSEEDVTKLGDYLSNNNLKVEYLFNNAGLGLFTRAHTGQKTLFSVYCNICYKHFF